MISSLPIRTHTALYHAYTEDKMHLNNEDFHNRINRIVGLEITFRGDAYYIYTLEMFRRSQNADYMQQAEKDFWNNLAFIYDRVQFFADLLRLCSKID